MQKHWLCNELHNYATRSDDAWTSKISPMYVFLRRILLSFSDAKSEFGAVPSFVQYRDAFTVSQSVIQLRLAYVDVVRPQLHWIIIVPHKQCNNCIALTNINVMPSRSLEVDSMDDTDAPQGGEEHAPVADMGGLSTLSAAASKRILETMVSVLWEKLISLLWAQRPCCWEYGARMFDVMMCNGEDCVRDRATGYNKSKPIS